MALRVSNFPLCSSFRRCSTRNNLIAPNSPNSLPAVSIKNNSSRSIWASISSAPKIPSELLVGDPLARISFFPSICPPCASPRSHLRRVTLSASRSELMNARLSVSRVIYDTWIHGVTGSGGIQGGGGLTATWVSVVTGGKVGEGEGVETERGLDNSLPGLANRKLGYASSYVIGIRTVVRPLYLKCTLSLETCSTRPLPLPCFNPQYSLCLSPLPKLSSRLPLFVRVYEFM